MTSDAPTTATGATDLVDGNPRARLGRRTFGAVTVVLASSTAWLTSVWPAARLPGAPAVALALAGLALAAPVVGLIIARRDVPSGRRVGLIGAAFSSGLVWVLSREALATARWATLELWVGALCWAVSGLAWALLERPNAPPAVPRERPLEPRRPTSSLGMAAVAAAALYGVVLLGAATLAASPSRAVLATAAAMLLAVVLLDGTSSMALRSIERRPAPLDRLRGALGGLAGLALGVALALLLRFGS